MPHRQKGEGRGKGKVPWNPLGDGIFGDIVKEVEGDRRGEERRTEGQRIGLARHLFF